MGFGIIPLKLLLMIIFLIHVLIMDITEHVIDQCVYFPSAVFVQCAVAHQAVFFHSIFHACRLWEISTGLRAEHTHEVGV